MKGFILHIPPLSVELPCNTVLTLSLALMFLHLALLKTIKNQTKPESKPGTCHPVFRSHANQSPIMTASSNEVQVGVFDIFPVILYEYLRTYVNVK